MLNTSLRNKAALNTTFTVEYSSIDAMSLTPDLVGANPNTCHLSVRKAHWERLVRELRLHSIDLIRARHAAQALSHAAEPWQIPELHKLVEDADLFVCETAASLLIQLDGVHSLSILLAAMRRLEKRGVDAGRIVMLIADLLTQVQEDAQPYLLQMMKDSSEDVRRSAVWAWGFLQSDVAIEALLWAVSDRDSGIRAAAANSLKRFNREAVTKALIQALDDHDPQVRISAAAALRTTGNYQAVPALQRALNDPEELVRMFARDTLKKMGIRTRVTHPPKLSRLHRALFS